MEMTSKEAQQSAHDVSEHWLVKPFSFVQTGRIIKFLSFVLPNASCQCKVCPFFETKPGLGVMFSRFWAQFVRLSIFSKDLYRLSLFWIESFYYYFFFSKNLLI